MPLPPAVISATFITHPSRGYPTAAQGAAHTTDGLGMLIGQAAEAFYVWRQIRPEVVPVITALRRQLAEKK